MYEMAFANLAQFKRGILHALIAKLSTCKIRRLIRYFQIKYELSRIFDRSSEKYDWSSTVDLNAAFYMRRA